MLEKLIGPGIEYLSGLIPGYKTAVVGATALGMAICELSNYFFQYGHYFDASTWSAIPATAGMTIAIRKYREAKKELDDVREVSL
jgi:hypothetical protein